MILASASPRRLELLAQIGLVPEVRAPDIDEARRPDEPPAAYVRRIARAKALAIAAAAGDARPVLGADTVVVVDGTVLGKPADDDDARRMLQRLSGRTHEVMSAVAVAFDGGCDDRLSVTRVTMRALDAGDIDAYCATGEPRGKAGGYAIQGRAAAFVTHIDGSYSGVVGLPLYEATDLLAAAGVRP